VVIIRYGHNAIDKNSGTHPLLVATYFSNIMGDDIYVANPTRLQKKALKARLAP
jgi:enolase